MDDDSPEEELELRLGKIEDNAWLAMSSGFALDYVMGNLLLVLHQAGLVNLPAFSSRLQAGLPALSAPTRIGVEALLAGLSQSLQAGDQATYRRPDDRLH